MQGARGLEQVRIAGAKQKKSEHNSPVQPISFAVFRLFHHDHVRDRSFFVLFIFLFISRLNRIEIDSATHRVQFWVEGRWLIAPRLANCRDQKKSAEQPLEQHAEEGEGGKKYKKKNKKAHGRPRAPWRCTECAPWRPPAGRPPPHDCAGGVGKRKQTHACACERRGACGGRWRGWREEGGLTSSPIWVPSHGSATANAASATRARALNSMASKKSLGEKRKRKEERKSKEKKKKREGGWNQGAVTGRAR